MYPFEQSRLLAEAKQSKRTPTVPFLFLIFFLVYYIANIFSGVPLGIYVAIYMFQNGLPELLLSETEIDPEVYTEWVMRIASSPSVLLLSLFLQVMLIVVSVIYCRKIEQRSYASMGMVKKSAPWQYLLGLLVGLLLFSAVYGINAASGAIQMNGLNPKVDLGLLLWFFFAFLVQGAGEEFLLRGFFMMSASRTTSVFTAVLLNALIFALMHNGNVGIGVLPLVNLFLFGVFASLYMLRFENIWGVCAVHGMWNFAQGNLFGCAVSGMETGTSLLRSVAVEGRALTHGGAFGPEGGIAVTLVLLIGTMLVIFLPQKSKE